MLIYPYRLKAFISLNSLTSKCRKCHEDWNEEGEISIKSGCERIGHSLGPQDLRDAERRVEGDVGDGVDHGDQDDGDADCSWKISDGVLEFIDDKVEIIPSVVRKQSRVEGKS